MNKTSLLWTSVAVLAEILVRSPQTLIITIVREFFLGKSIQEMFDLILKTKGLLRNAGGSVPLLSKLNTTFFGYFDPENAFVYDRNK